MKLNIFFNDAYVELGIFAMQDFLSLFIKDGEEMDTVMVVTLELIEKVNSMTAMQSGFTQEVKDFFLKHLEKNIGKKILMVNQWITSEDNRAYTFRVVNFLNTGSDLSTSIDLAKIEPQKKAA